MSSKREINRLKSRIFGLKQACEVLPLLNPEVFKTFDNTQELILRFTDQLSGSESMSISTGGMTIQHDGEGDFEVWINPGLVAKYLKEHGA